MGTFFRIDFLNEMLPPWKGKRPKHLPTTQMSLKRLLYQTVDFLGCNRLGMQSIVIAMKGTDASWQARQIWSAHPCNWEKWSHGCSHLHRDNSDLDSVTSQCCSHHALSTGASSATDRTITRKLLYFFLFLSENQFCCLLSLFSFPTQTQPYPFCMINWDDRSVHHPCHPPWCLFWLHLFQVINGERISINRIFNTSISLPTWTRFLIPCIPHIPPAPMYAKSTQTKTCVR